MNIIKLNKIKNQNKHPYFYLNDFIVFIKQNENKNVIYFVDEFNNTICCKFWTNKFFKLIQPIYPPLTITGERLTENQEQLFLETWINYIKENKIAHRISQPENFSIFKSVPEKSVYVPFGTYYLDLKNFTEDELFKNLHSKHRNVIKNAKKNGVVLKYGKECIVDFYNIYKQTMNRSNMYCQDISYFENFYNELEQSTIIGVAYFNNTPQGGIFMPFTEFGAFYLYGASAEKIEINGSINYLHWNTIVLLKNKGVNRYDFVGARLSDVSGTKLEGIQQFKSRFGAQLEKGYLWKADINKFYCLIFDSLIVLNSEFKGTVKLYDIIDSELIKINRTNHKLTYDKRIELKTKSFLSILNKKSRIFRKKISKKTLINSLELAGIKNGDNLMVHSSLSKIGNIKGGANTVISALIDKVGNEGNLIMPAYSYINTMEDTANNKEYFFDPKVNSSVVGIITETFRKLPRVERSIHPTHSVCAYGPLAEYITKTHYTAETNFGPNTPFDKIRELNGKIVGLGISIGPVTIYHSIEDFFPSLFSNIYLPNNAPIKIIQDGIETFKHIKIHNKIHHNIRIDKSEKIESWLTNHFRKKGILHESTFGSSTIWWMNIQELFEEQLALMKLGISIYKVPSNEEG